jgi:hypothetical protein
MNMSESGELTSPLYPYYDRVTFGREIGALNELQGLAAPNLTWRLIGWTWRADTVAVELENSNRYGESLVTWRGVDKFTLREGKIAEEIVYADTAVLQACVWASRLIH